ncbi:sensor histidine kinase [Rubripirellula reticaptiva]|uniref:histidine kinase n=1 Tax=Rubripirellula reticaptiva TaxID=2528013 RepID=A0A5C6EU10_9BACT|nr:ATP-binding protein [Rubripirellula reticaptiva]TWU51567.1 Sensor kinase CusS [Rubripirellula reticaptiva]
MKRLSIRVRLTLWYTLFFLLLLVVMGSLVLWRVRSHLVENADRSLAEEISELFDEMQMVSDRDEMVAELDRRFSSHSHYHFQVLDQDLNPVFTSRFLANLDLPAATPPSDMRGGEYSDIQWPGLGKFRLVNLALRDSRSNPQLIRAISPRQMIDRDFQSYLWMLATLGPIALIAALIAGYIVAGHVLSPIKQITAKAKFISADRLDERLPVVHEFDELGELSTTLNETFDRLEKSVNSMKRFTSDAAHELRSPVAVLRTEAEIALRKPRSLEEYRAVVETTLAETIRLGELVDQLLTLSRHDAGVEEILTDEVPAAALLGDVVSRFVATANEKGVVLEAADLPECFINGYDVWISQLFFNLIDNAIKFTPSGGMVKVYAANDAKYTTFFISDTGVGIAPDQIPHVFERFYRADAAREHYRGTGLGLSICKSIVDAHHGTIDVSGNGEVGTIVSVRLPRIPAFEFDTDHGVPESQIDPASIARGEVRTL